MTRSQVDSLADELAALLRWDPAVLKAYAFLLSKAGEVMADELGAGAGVSGAPLDELLAALERDGLTVKGPAGIFPVHPRLGIGNVYRLSLAKDPSVSAVRPKVDSVVSILASYRERIEDREYAGPMGRPEGRP